MKFLFQQHHIVFLHHDYNIDTLLMFFFCSGAMAQEEIKEQPYADYTYADHTLTFYYGVKPEPSDQSEAFDIVTGVEIGSWCRYYTLVSRVRFDQSFA